MHISLAAETLFHIGFLPVTNSLLTTWLVMLFLFVFAFKTSRSLKRVPGRFQVFVEILIGGLQDFFSQMTGKLSNVLFPLIATIFIFVIVSNYSGLLPGASSIGIYKTEEAVEAVTEEKTSPPVETPKTDVKTDVKTEAEPVAHTEVATKKEEEKPSVVETPKQSAHKQPTREFLPLFRAPTADLNMTLALGLIAFGAMQFFGFKMLGKGYLKKFLNFSNPIMFFVGVLEIISDISKIISFAFRLFGNIFAGEVLLAVMAFLMPFLLPIPFLGLEIFVGFIQGLVFAMLTAVFTNIAVSHGESHEH
jgi:F-type H+-transporting ATPase subunit a